MDTDFEINLNRTLLKYRPVNRPYPIYFRQNNQWVELPNRDFIEPGRYRARAGINHKKSQLFFINVALRVLPKTENGVRMFTDETFANETSRVTFDDQGGFTYIELTRRLRRTERLLSIGVYGEIVPVGHYWTSTGHNV